MKRIHITITTLCCIAVMATSCSMFGLDLQEDYPYEKSTLDAHINKPALQYLKERGKTPVVANDTIFKWMELGLEYAGIDVTEYEKSGRTFIFLNNSAIRVRNVTTGVITAGLWFDLPIMDKNPDGSQKFMADGVTPVSHPATRWNEYSKETVKNYFLYHIIQGEYSFAGAEITNTSLPTLLPAGTIASKESKLGYLVPALTPNYSVTGGRIITYAYPNGGSGFDPEGKINMKIVSSDYSPLQVNDVTTLVTSGIIATNGTIHVSGTTSYPCRY